MSQQYDGLFWRAYHTNYCLTIVAMGNRHFFYGRSSLLAIAHLTLQPNAHLALVWALILSLRLPKKGVQKRQTFGNNWLASVCAYYNAKGSCPVAFSYFCMCLGGSGVGEPYLYSHHLLQLAKCTPVSAVPLPLPFSFLCSGVNGREHFSHILMTCLCISFLKAFLRVFALGLTTANAVI